MNAAVNDQDLGPLLFQGKPSISRGVVFAVLGVLILLLALVILNVDDPRTPLIAGLNVLLAAIFIALGLFYLGPRVGIQYFFHERGVRRVRSGQERVLLYAEAVELTFVAQHVHYQGAYIGSPSRLTLRSADRREAPFVLNRGSWGEPVDMITICWHIAGIMAQKLAENLAQGQDVEWTPKMRLHATGIEVRDGTIIVRDGQWAPNIVPWANVAQAEIVDGMFRLQVQGEMTFRVIVGANTPNFYPGYAYAMRHLGPEDQDTSK